MAHNQQIQDIDRYKVPMSMSVRDAVRKMSEGGREFCVCVDQDDKVVGVFTDGDFRAAVFSGIQLDDKVLMLVNKKFKSVTRDYSDKEIIKLFRDTIIQQVPVLDNGKLVKIIHKDIFLSDTTRQDDRALDNSVVIMAGGRGARLDPFTRILPKPLIPLGDNPVIKVIMDEFSKYAIRKFYVSVNDKSRMIKAYFHDHQLPYEIKYIEEDKPLGTVGALKHLEDTFTSPFFVTNCDIIVRANYASALDFHIQGGHDLTLVGAMRNFMIPYGVCDIDQNGRLQSLREKPNYDFLVNTGFYVFNPQVIKHISPNRRFDITDLITELRINKLSIGVFPVTEHDWVDIGQWSEYHKAINELEGGK